eukprot:CAMPEP_0117675718 /NCGR_PEP_ID=MMETSP0804-20121206/15764_1 /TAXON_ID=1074897 /ORGANISM="Tetraselmis astigmatica, Strain CCMP880" /LENGTH=472 /DNA_ID=CAMNT_0005484759 /DNA_START=304 /DNA_END=1722 /DNA_ORIENTATION=-
MRRPNANRPGPLGKHVCMVAAGGGEQEIPASKPDKPPEDETLKANQSPSSQASASGLVQTFAGLALLLGADKALKMVFSQAGWSFPAPLAGMFLIMAVLQTLAVTSSSTLKSVESFFQPALNWIARWLPLFYVPSLVMLPIVLKQVPSAAMAKVVLIVSIGMVLSLIVTAQVAVAIRQVVKTEVARSGPSTPPLPGPNRTHQIGWGSIAVGCLAAAVLLPSYTTMLTLPFLLSGTVGGYLIGSAMPAGAKKVVNPIITTCVVGIGSAALWGAVTGNGLEAALMAYKSGSGAGDLLMSFLGIVILSFGFRVFSQRELVVRHRYEILGCTLISALFSLFSTALMGRALGLDPLLTCSICPRAVTVALALPIAQQLQAAVLAGITAAAVCFEGLMGASLAIPLLNKFGFQDPIVRGLSTAGAAHGLGTASLASNEPDALPFCALAYAIIGILATLLSCVPFIRTSLMAIAGVPVV